MASGSTHYRAGLGGVLRSGVVSSGQSTTREKCKLRFRHNQLQILAGQRLRDSAGPMRSDSNCKGSITGDQSDKGKISQVLPPNDGVYPAYGNSRKTEALPGSDLLVPNALRFTFSVRFAPADLATGNDIEDQTNSRDTRYPSLFVR